MSTNMKHDNNKKKGKQGLEVVIFIVLSMALPVGYIMYSEHKAANHTAVTESTAINNSSDSNSTTTDDTSAVSNDNEDPTNDATAIVKLITIEVVNSSGETTTYEVETDAEYLSGAMKETKGLEFSGSEGDYGLMLTTVNGEEADFNKNGAYWSIMVNGEYGNYGIDQQPLTDGDTYQIVYTKS